MNEVNRTLFIPLYGKASVSKQNVILKDPDAERIWDAERFPVRGKSASKWLAYNMAMRARVFDDWTDRMLEELPDALVLHVGCGLDSRSRRVTRPYRLWLDCDLPDVIAVRRKYFAETDRYRMQVLDACDPDQVRHRRCRSASERSEHPLRSGTFLYAGGSRERTEARGTGGLPAAVYRTRLR